MPDSNKNSQRFVIPLEDVVATILAIGVLAGITFLTLIALR